MFAVLFAGATNIDQTVTSATATNSTPSPSPFTSITPQSIAVTSTNTQPTGSTAIDDRDLTSGSGTQTRPNGASQGFATFATSTADANTNVGDYNSIAALDSNNLFVSYKDVTNNDLKFAKTSDGGDNWTLKTVDTQNIDTFTSIAVLPTGSPYTIYISYYHSGTDDLRLAASTDGGDNWAVSTVDSVGDVGKWSSIGAADVNNLYISYFDDTSNDLRVANTTDGGDTWATSTIDSTGNVGQYSSIEVLSTSTAYISYFDDTNDELEFAKTTNGGDTWTLVKADDSTGTHTVRQYTSIDAVDSNTIFIAYNSSGGSRAPPRVARSTDGGATWSTSKVDGGNTGSANPKISAVDANTIYVTYRRGNSGPAFKIRVYVSTDGGVTWSSAFSDPGTSTSNREQSIVAVDGSTVFVVYHANSRLEFAESTGGSTWYTGTATLDADSDGSVDDTLNFVMTDLDSSGGSDTVDRIELSTDDGTFGEGTQTDDTTGSNDDERFDDDGSGSSSSDDVKLGANTFTVLFNHALSGSNAAGTLTSKTWYTGSFNVDADADGSANDTVYFAMVDDDSDGVYEKTDLSLGNDTFGEEPFQGLGFLTDNAINSGNDEVISSTVVEIGTAYKFDVEFNNNPTNGASTISVGSKTWYTGTFNVDIDDDGSDESLDFVLIDANSDGLYDTINVDANDNGSYSSNEVVTSGGTISIGGSTVAVNFSANPGNGISISLAEQSSAVANVGNPGVSDSAEGLPTAAEVLEATDSEVILQTREVESLIESTFQVDVELDLSPGQEVTPEVFEALVAELQTESEGFEQAVAAIEIPPQTSAPSPSRVSVDTSGQPLVNDEIVLTLDFEMDDPELHIARIAAMMGGDVVGAFPEGRMYQVQFAAESLDNLSEVRALIDRFPAITDASRHFLIDPEGPFSRVPDDNVFASWDVGSPGGNNWNMELIDAPGAWDITTGSDAVSVAVIDGDMDGGHSDLQGNVLSSVGEPSIIARGHGTHVSGIICAEGNNGVGISGVAWDCSMRMYDFGARSSVQAAVSMMEAVNDGARIVNMSLQWVDNSKCGTPGSAETSKKVEETNAIFARAIQFARASGKDVLWVIAAGNECRDTRFASPASLVSRFSGDIITVASVDEDGDLSSFSNFGELVNVAAPGGGILSTLPRVCEADESGTIQCRDEFGVKAGTSMAAPHISGLAVLMRTVNPDLRNNQIKECILRTANRDVSGHDFKVVDAADAVGCAQNFEQFITGNQSGENPTTGVIPTNLPAGGDFLAGESGAVSSVSDGTTQRPFGGR